MNNENTFEPRTEKSLRQNVWSMARAKVSNKNWSFRPEDKRRKNISATPEFLEIKMTKGRLYKVGNYEGATLEEVKEFARLKNMPALKMGAIRIAV